MNSSGARTDPWELHRRAFVMQSFRPQGTQTVSSQWDTNRTTGSQSRQPQKISATAVVWYHDQWYRMWLRGLKETGAQVDPYQSHQYCRLGRVARPVCWLELWHKLVYDEVWRHLTMKYLQVIKLSSYQVMKYLQIIFKFKYLRQKGNVRHRTIVAGSTYSHQDQPSSIAARRLLSSTLMESNRFAGTH